MREAEMPITGFGISSYRSFGRQMQVIGPCKRINIIIGPNNSGKSNVLSFLTKHGDALLFDARAGDAPKFKGLDLHQGCGDAYRYLLAVPREGFLGRRFGEVKMHRVGPCVRHLEKLLSSPLFSRDDEDCYWFEVEVSGSKKGVPGALIQDAIPILQEAEWHDVWNRVTGRSGGVLADWARELIVSLYPSLGKVAGFAHLPPVRYVTKEDGNLLAGAGVIEKLAALQHPSFGEPGREQFLRINAFLQSVTGHGDAGIEVPHDKAEILVKMHQRTIPLERCGTGISAVMIIAIAATVYDKHVVCLEEPENHLHPALQRKLMVYLSESTNNQYFITTHSPTMMNHPDVGVMHVSLGEDNASRVVMAVGGHRRREICESLGARPSDVLLASFIIWVEGPTDRLYLREWLRREDDRLEEGVHYSMMFYGGRLLSHVSVGERGIGDLIELQSINPRMAIVLDSDARDESQLINTTKSRIVEEAKGNFRACLVTEGREVENYVTRSAMEAALRSCCKDFACVPEVGKFSVAYTYQDSNGEEVVFRDKVALARAVVEQDQGGCDVANWPRLAEFLNDVASRIADANGLN